MALLDGTKNLPVTGSHEPEEETAMWERGLKVVDYQHASQEWSFFVVSAPVSPAISKCAA